MDQDHEDFNDDEQMEEENPPQENPPTEVNNLPEEPAQRDGPIDVQMNNEVKLNPPGIHDVYSHLMRMASINIINAHHPNQF